MSFPRTIIYIDEGKDKNYIYTLEGYKYWVDDVTEDGEVYIEYVDEWLPLFMSEADLKIIRDYKFKEEFMENILFMMSKVDSLSVD